MKRLFIILVVFSLLLLPSCNNPSNKETGSNNSSTESVNGNASINTDSIWGIINNTESYNDCIKKTVDVEDFAQTVGLPVKSYFSLKDINAKYEIECLRDANDGIVYSVYKTENDGIIYAFFGGNEESAMLYNWYYVEKPLYYKNFKSIKEDVSTIEDMEKIDPATSIYKNLIDYSNISILKFEHYLNDGILIVLYKRENGKLLVDKIEYSKKFISDSVGYADGSGFKAKILDIDFVK